MENTITTMLVYTKDTLFYVCEAIVRILRLNRILRLGHESEEQDEETTWTMKIENLRPEAPVQPEHEPPRAISEEDRRFLPSTAIPVVATRRDKLGDIVAIDPPEHIYTALAMSAHMIRALADRGIIMETPEMHSLVMPSLYSNGVVKVPFKQDTKIEASSYDSPNDRLPKEEVDRASVESNATDDSEDDRLRGLSRDFAQLSPTEKVPSSSFQNVVSMDMEKNRFLHDEQAMTEESEPAEWSSSSDDDDDALIAAFYSAPRFMPQLGESTFLL
jgi:hypothetical protein